MIQAKVFNLSFDIKSSPYFTGVSTKSLGQLWFKTKLNFRRSHERVISSKEITAQGENISCCASDKTGSSNGVSPKPVSVILELRIKNANDNLLSYI